MRKDFEAKNVFHNHSGKGMISYFTSYEEAKEFYENLKEPKNFHDLRDVEVIYESNRYLAAVEYLIR